MRRNSQSSSVRDEFFPETEQVRKAFVASELHPLRRTPWIIADRRLKGRYGMFTGEARQASWRSREANRYITELYRQRELRQVKWSIYVAIIIGVLALVATVLAMPTEKSVLSRLTCYLFGSLCEPAGK
jgi:hypothetical protein